MKNKGRGAKEEFRHERRHLLTANQTDEILDHPLRVPYLPFSEGCIDLIRCMLDRDVDRRLDIEGVRTHAWLLQEPDG